MKKVLTMAIVGFMIVAGLALWIIGTGDAELVPNDLVTEDITPEDLVQQALSIPEEQSELASYSNDALIETLIIKNAIYEIVSSDKETVTVEITAPDIRALFSDLVDPDKTVTDTNAEYEKILNSVTSSLNSNFPTVTNTVTVDIGREEGKIFLIKDRAFMDALYGGMLSLFDELMGMGE